MDTYVSERFKHAVRNHRLTIEQDDGVFRCIHLGAPRTSIYSFRLTTWPGHLAISGDLDDYVFRRLHDMFEFFRFAGPDYAKSDYPNYDYWAEKAQAVSRHGNLKTFSERYYKAAIRSDMADHLSRMCLFQAKACVREARIDDLFDPPHDTREAIEAAMRWCCPVTNDYPFFEFYEHELQEYSFGFQFACHAIQWGIKQYDLHKQGRTQKDHDQLVLRGET